MIRIEYIKDPFQSGEDTFLVELQKCLPKSKYDLHIIEPSGNPKTWIKKIDRSTGMRSTHVFIGRGVGGFFALNLRRDNCVYKIAVDPVTFPFEEMTARGYTNEYITECEEIVTSNNTAHMNETAYILLTRKDTKPNYLNQLRCLYSCANISRISNPTRVTAEIVRKNFTDPRRVQELFIRACWNDLHDDLKRSYILGGGADVNLFHTSVLEILVKTNNIESVRFLLEEGLELPISTHHHDIINVAASNGNVQMVQLLLEYGARWRWPEKYLQSACKTKSMDLIDYILSKGTPVSFGCMRMACTLKDTTVIERLIEAGGKVYYKRDENLNKQLMAQALRSNSEKVVQFLLDNEHSPEIDLFQENPILHDEHFTNKKIFKMFLQQSKALTTDSSVLESMLKIACMNDWTDILRDIAIKADIKIEKYSYGDGNTLLHFAAYNSEKPETLKFLLKNNANIDAANDRGETPLHNALEFGDSIVITKFLLGAGVQVNKPDKKGKTPLFTAALNCRESGIYELSALLDYGADVNIQDNEGCTALHRLLEYISYEKEGACIYLVRHGADINIKNSAGKSSYEIAAEYNIAFADELMSEYRR